jgi:large subunit ribosomal protein L3
MLVSEIFSEKPYKELERKIILPKKIKKKIEDIKDYDDVRLLVCTQPKLTGIGKKKPVIFEICLGGKKEEKLKYAKEKLGKEIVLEDVFKEGQQVDIHAITKGKGFQGAVKRFGIGLKHHKSEKGRRTPGSLGGWKGQGHFMYRIAHAGQMGYHQRTEYNKWLIKIGKKADEINVKGGFLRFGLVKNPYVLVKGSVGGAVKRLIRFNHATRENKNIPTEAPAIQYTSLNQ